MGLLLLRGTDLLPTSRNHNANDESNRHEDEDAHADGAPAETGPLLTPCRYPFNKQKQRYGVRCEA